MRVVYLAGYRFARNSYFLRDCSPAIADSAQWKQARANETLRWLPSYHLLAAP